MGERFDLSELVLVVAERQHPVGSECPDEVGSGQVVLSAEPGTEWVGCDVSDCDQHRISGRLRAHGHGWEAAQGEQEHQQHAGHGNGPR
jgi:hypothetical protein